MVETTFDRGDNIDWVAGEVVKSRQKETREFVVRHAGGDVDIVKTALFVGERRR